MLTFPSGTNLVHPESFWELGGFEEAPQSWHDKLYLQTYVFICLQMTCAVILLVPRSQERKAKGAPLLCVRKVPDEPKLLWKWQQSRFDEHWTCFWVFEYWTGRWTAASRSFLQHHKFSSNTWARAGEPVSCGSSALNHNNSSLDFNASWMGNIWNPRGLKYCTECLFQTLRFADMVHRSFKATCNPN